MSEDNSYDRLIKKLEDELDDVIEEIEDSEHELVVCYLAYDEPSCRWYRNEIEKLHAKRELIEREIREENRRYETIF